MTSQELAAGTPVSARFKRLGVPSSTLNCSPRHIFAMISGMPSSGKTSFLLNCDTCFIINCDEGTMPTDDPAALTRVWPGKSPDGQTIDIDGKPFVLSWAHLIEVVKTLKALADDGAPRPDIVAFDTIAGLIQLGMDHISKVMNKEWREMDGRQAYDRLYTMILKMANDLRRHGYAVYFTCHIVNKIVQLGEQQFSKQVPELTITDGFWKRIFWQLEMSAVIQQEWVTRQIEVDRKLQDGTLRGKTLKSVEERQFRLTVKDPVFAGIAKARVDFDDIILPKKGSWEVFENHYMNAPLATD